MVIRTDLTETPAGHPELFPGEANPLGSLSGIQRSVLREILRHEAWGQADLETYYREKTALGLQLGLPQEVILEALTEGLPFSDQRLIRVVPPESLGEWFRLAQRIHGPNISTARHREEQPPTMSGPYPSTPRRTGAWTAPTPPSNCYTITAGTTTPLTRNTDIIHAIKQPYNRKTLQSFLGAVIVYNKFIPEYARLRAPLNNLLKKDVMWVWDEDCQKAFINLKECLTQHPILHLYKEGLPCQMYCDASTLGIAGILKQVHPDGKVYPVQYFSRTLRSHEQNYSISELECLAIVESVEKFRIYLMGRKFTIFSDHHALQWLKTIKNPSGRLFRWSLRLSSYEYEVRYIKGKQQYEADLLSRNPFCGFLDASLIKTHQPSPSGDSSLTTDHNGLHTVSRKVHTQYNHPGISQMTRFISAQYYWQGMSKDITQKVKTCPTCQLTKRPLGPTYGELGQPPEAKGPFDLLSLDTIAGFAKYGNTKIYLHVVVDHFSRYTWTFPSKSTSITIYQQVLKRVLQDVSPKRLLTDRAPAFTSPKFSSFLLNRSNHPLLTTSNNPQANGLCERLNATLTGKLRLLHLENPKVAWTNHPNIIISSSRDKSLIIWKITEDNNNYGIPHKRLKGHGHFVSDCTTSIDGTHALSASWDKTMRLWDLNTGVSIKRFVGHKNDVTSVSMSADSRIIASGSRDKTVKIWNTNGDKKFEFEDHTEWVSAVSFLPNETRDLVSAGWDKQVNLWNMYRCRLKSRYVGHRHQVNALTVSPDGNVCLSGSKDGKILMWDTKEHKCLTMMDNNESVESLAINPTKNFMSSTCGPAIKLWDLDHKTLVDEIRPGVTASRSLQPDFISQAWSTDGTTLYAGYTDGNIRFRLLLEQNQLLDIVDGKEIKPEALELRFLEPLMSCKTAAQMWTRLMSIHEQRSEIAIGMLWQQFFDARMSSSEDVSSYIAKIENLSARIQDAGGTITDDQKVAKIINSLPSSMRYFIPAWESQAPITQTLENLSARLLIEECRNQQADSSQGTGDIEILAMVNGKWITTSIRNVLYSSKLKKNLFSLGVCTEKGYRVDIDKDELRIYSRKELKAVGQHQDGLYKMMFRVNSSSQGFSVKINNLQLWHERLAHISLTTIREMAKKGLINGLHPERT
ncbi:hypothetical protein LAZ67_1001875 [Cordylochernes scorpioides]|uniref:Small ribosomal subunit protein RACK1 n=1 Tax=Cordylochernes scorpioides TaxID=51811 RepID=A0ABY6JVS4_9ARAC|nr:hypothetical protein LAZ67_1001875 [Cordylochernes scorpioides]